MAEYKVLMTDEDSMDIEELIIALAVEKLDFKLRKMKKAEFRIAEKTIRGVKCYRPEVKKRFLWFIWWRSFWVGETVWYYCPWNTSKGWAAREIEYYKELKDL